jgi:predicted transcriptional regulator
LYSFQDLIMSVTTIRLPEELSAELDRLAEETQSSRSNLINQAVKEYIVRTHTDAERWQETLAVLESVKAGRLAQGEEVDAWLAAWGKSNKKKSRR